MLRSLSISFISIFASSMIANATAIDLNYKIVKSIQVDPDYRAHGALISVANSDGSGEVDVCFDLNDAPDLKKAMLSLALTALTTGNSVRIWYENSAPMSWYAPGTCNKVMTITMNK